MRFRRFRRCVVRRSAFGVGGRSVAQKIGQRIATPWPRLHPRRAAKTSRWATMTMPRSLAPQWGAGPAPAAPAAARAPAAPGAAGAAPLATGTRATAIAAPEDPTAAAAPAVPVIGGTATATATATATGGTATATATATGGGEAAAAAVAAPRAVLAAALPG